MQLSDRAGFRLKLHDLHILMTVAQAGSMSKAATLLNTTQPAVSRSISLGLALLVSIAPVLSLISEVGAGVTYLSCTGTLSDNAYKPPEPWMTALTLDTERQTITLHGYAAVPFRQTDATIVFMPSGPVKYGVSTGVVNRITGEASIHILDDGFLIFRGICKPTQKLF